MSERRAGADDARADRADRDVEALRRRPRRAPTRPRPPARRRRSTRPQRSPSRRARAPSARAASPRARPAAHRRQLDVRDPYALADPRRGGRDLRVQRAADDRHARRGSRRARRLPRRAATAAWSGVYGSVITCAPGSASRSSPRVRFAWSTSNPPEPSPSSRAWTLTSTSSPSSTGPVSRGYATHGSPSTSIRARPPAPRRSPSPCPAAG